MKYIIIKTKKKQRAKKITESLNSIEFIKPKIKAQNIMINHQDLIDDLLLRTINKSLDNLIIKIFAYLTTEEDDQEETGLLYDELAKERSIILKKYEKDLSKEARDKYMKKIRIAAYELKKRLASYNYQKEPSKSR